MLLLRRLPAVTPVGRPCDTLPICILLSLLEDVGNCWVTGTAEGWGAVQPLMCGFLSAGWAFLRRGGGEGGRGSSDTSEQEQEIPKHTLRTGTPKTHFGKRNVLWGAFLRFACVCCVRIAEDCWRVPCCRPLIPECFYLFFVLSF